MNLVIMIFIFSGLKSGENTDEKSRMIKRPRSSRLGYHPYYGHHFDRGGHHSRSKERKSVEFSFSQYKPGQLSKPIMTGVSNALARLNYEFSGANDASKAISRTKNVPKFKKSEANTMEGILGNTTVGTNIPIEKAKNILIAATWRTGSTFLGDLLNTLPGSFYYFEPLHLYSGLEPAPPGQEYGPPGLATWGPGIMNQTSFLKSLYSCQFNSANLGYLHHVARRANRYQLSHYNPRLWRSCEHLLPEDILCLLPEYLNTVCPLYPIKLVKTVRSRVASLEELIKNSTLNLKVLVLVRDPRGTHNSRVSGPVSTWCSSPSCSDPQVWCPHLLADITAAFKLERSYPGTVLLVRYEDLSMDPITTTTNILTFLQLPLTRDIQLFIETHSYAQNTPVWNRSHKKKDSKKDPYGTIRDSSATASAWKKSLDLQDIFQIQQVCREPMEILGYTFIKEETDLKSQKYPLEKTAEEVWFGNVNS